MAKAMVDAEAVKHADAESYDAVTAEYDRFVERFSGRYVERVVERARIGPGGRVLDVGTGTGILALQAARRAGPSGRVTGIDLSRGMLAVARAKAARAGLANVEFLQRDAERLEVGAGAFDAVVSLFALRHFPNPDAALVQMHAALRPGGRLVVAIGAGAPLFSAAGLAAGARRVFDEALTRTGRQLRACDFIDRLVGERLPHHELEGPAGTHESSMGPGELPERVRRAGFVEARAEWLGNRAVVPTPEEFWDLQSTMSTLARSRLHVAPPATVAQIRERFLERCRAVQARGGTLVYPTGVLLVAAARPA